MPLVSKPAAFACRAERLARARSGPDGAVVGPSCLSQGVAPYADSGKEVALGVLGEFVWSDIFYAPFVHDAGGNVALVDEFSQPLGGEWVYFVVVCGGFHGHGSIPLCYACTIEGGGAASRAMWPSGRLVCHTRPVLPSFPLR